VDALAVQTAFIPTIISRLGTPRWLALAIDWTMFESTLLDGSRRAYHVLRIAIPRRGRALPLFQQALDVTDGLPKGTYAALERDAMAAVVRALPPGVRPLILADRGFGHAPFLTFLREQHLDYVVRLSKGTWITEPDGTSYKLSPALAHPGDGWLAHDVRFGHTSRGKPRNVLIHLVVWWRLPQHRRRATAKRARTLPQHPWYLATSLLDPHQAATWYRQRFWIEESFKDSKSRFGLAATHLADAQRLTRLLMAFTLALAWLTLLALPVVRALPERWNAATSTWGQASLLRLALEYLDRCPTIPAVWFPDPLLSLT
jgi:hypothetical protein